MARRKLGESKALLKPLCRPPPCSVHRAAAGAADAGAAPSRRRRHRTADTAADAPQTLQVAPPPPPSPPAAPPAAPPIGPLGQLARRCDRSGRPRPQLSVRATTASAAGCGRALDGILTAAHRRRAARPRAAMHVERASRVVGAWWTLAALRQHCGRARRLFGVGRDCSEADNAGAFRINAPLVR